MVSSSNVHMSYAGSHPYLTGLGIFGGSFLQLACCLTLYVERIVCIFLQLFSVLTTRLQHNVCRAGLSDSHACKAQRDSHCACCKCRNVYL